MNSIAACESFLLGTAMLLVLWLILSSRWRKKIFMRV